MKNNIIWIILSFENLSTTQLYDILHLRNKVFAVEQADVYLDVDYKDKHAYHLMGYVSEQLVAYCRIFPSIDRIVEAKIGRVVVSANCRKYGLGRLLMNEAINFVENELEVSSIFISAQVYLQSFYQSLGFVAQGEPYMDGTIEHVDMIRSDNDMGR